MSQQELQVLNVRYLESEITKNEGQVRVQNLQEQKLALQISLLSSFDKRKEEDSQNSIKFTVEEMFSCIL